MDFAKKQLEKYGWKEGQGLGKNETGISTAIKPKLKFDNAGIGHNPSDEFKNNWWDNLYNRAACNINVSVNSTDIQIKLNSENSIDISTKGYLEHLKQQNKKLEYGSFIKRSTLTDEGLTSVTNTCNIVEDFNKLSTKVLNDEELLVACEGRTGHKGARHGLRQSGKLSRLEKQEKMLLKKLKKVSITDDDNGSKKNLEKKLKKVNDQKDKSRSVVLSTSNTEETYLEKNFLTSPVKSNKSRKKQRKRVSFNETVTEYQTEDLDSSSHGTENENKFSCATSTATVVAVRLQDEKSTSSYLEKNNDQDEGIDCPDLDLKNSDSNSNSDEFDTPVYKELSKKERKILRRKLRKQNEKHSKTASFLEGVLGKVNDMDAERKIQMDGKCPKCSKRKLKFEPDDGDESDAKKGHFELDQVDKKKMKKIKRRQRKLEKRLNKVVNSFNSCKISDSE